MLNAEQRLEMRSGVPTQWAGLSRHLIARIFPCDFEGSEIDGAESVFGPLSDANFDLTLNWQSPFENTGPESKLPSMMAMIQSGQMGIVANALQAGGFANEPGTLSNSLAESAKRASTKLVGKTGITKLNSRQVFSGMPPVKLNFTLHFRAMSDPQSEVEIPYCRLLEMALPKKLAEDGSLAEAIKTNGGAVDKVLTALFPSDAPTMVGMIYAGKRYSPMVIEHLSNHIDIPIDTDGYTLHRAVQVSLSTLAALDRQDVRSIFMR